jgi:hypothetical protein
MLLAPILAVRSNDQILYALFLLLTKPYAFSKRGALWPSVRVVT